MPANFKSDKIALESEAREWRNSVARSSSCATAAEWLRRNRFQPCASARIKNLAHLPERYRQINRKAIYPVHYSQRLEKMLEKVRRARQPGCAKIVLRAAGGGSRKYHGTRSHRFLGSRRAGGLHAPGRQAVRSRRGENHPEHQALGGRGARRPRVSWFPAATLTRPTIPNSSCFRRTA